MRDDVFMERASLILVSSVLLLCIGTLCWSFSKKPSQEQTRIDALADASAIDLLKKRAEAGDATAQYELGVIYLFGQGVEKDNVDAYAWLNLSAANGSDDAAWRRDSIVRMLTPQQISDAEKRTEELKKLIAEKQADSE